MDVNIQIKEIPELNEHEKILKEAYMKDGKELLDNKMTFEELRRYERDGRCPSLSLNYSFWDISKGYQGNIITEKNYFKEEYEIYMTVHPRYSYPVMHNHNYIEIVYVYSGKCVHFVEDQSFEMREGEFCILSPHAMHAISVGRDDTIVMNIMVSKNVFNQQFLELLQGGEYVCQFFEKLLYRKEFTGLYILYPTGEDVWVKLIVAKMWEEVERKSYGYRKSLSLYLQQLFIHLIRKYETEAVISVSEETILNTHVIAVLEYLAVHYNHTTLSQTAEYFNYTPNYFGKMLKQNVGKSYREIILGYQMENAKKLLLDSNLGINEISRKTGCFDASHFTKKFKKIYGMTPKKYREQMRKKKSE